MIALTVFGVAICVSFLLFGCKRKSNLQMKMCLCLIAMAVLCIAVCHIMVTVMRADSIVRERVAMESILSLWKEIRTLKDSDLEDAYINELCEMPPQKLFSSEHQNERVSFLLKWDDILEEHRQLKIQKTH